MKQYSEDEIYIAERLGMPIEEIRPLMRRVLVELASTTPGGLTAVERALEHYLAQEASRGKT